MKMLDIDVVKDHLDTQAADAWLIYSFRDSNPVLPYVLPNSTTPIRRVFLIIPRSGEPSLIVHKVDNKRLKNMAYKAHVYTDWRELRGLLQKLTSSFRRVAIEYSPGGAIPAASWVDAGTIDLLRGLGLEIVSSADIFQATAAAWSDAALASHVDACRLVSEVRDVAFNYIRQSVGCGQPITEFDVQELILDEFSRRKLETENRPIVAVNSHSGDPHY